jgi:RHS repeat-associated protein
LGSVLCGGVTCYPQSGATSQAIGQQFTGMMHDSDTGMDYFYARHYSGAQGRFTSGDLPFIDQHAADPQSWNLYGYVRNNPLRYVDFDGRFIQCKDGVDGRGRCNPPPDPCALPGSCGGGPGGYDDGRSRRRHEPIGNPPGQDKDPDPAKPQQSRLACAAPENFPSMVTSRRLRKRLNAAPADGQLCAKAPSTPPPHGAVVGTGSLLSAAECWRKMSRE